MSNEIAPKSKRKYVKKKDIKNTESKMVLSEKEFLEFNFPKKAEETRAQYINVFSNCYRINFWKDCYIVRSFFVKVIKDEKSIFSYEIL